MVSRRGSRKDREKIRRSIFYLSLGQLVISDVIQWTSSKDDTTSRAL